MISSELEGNIKDIVERSGYELYDIETLKENDNLIFRISIVSADINAQITHDDCKKVNDLISPLLDVHDPFNEAYFLEISSAGLERVLKKPHHFRLSKGQKLEIKLLDKSKVIGVLGSSDDNGFYLDDIYYKYSDIKKAKSYFEW